MTENANYEKQECKGSELGVISVTLKMDKNRNHQLFMAKDLGKKKKQLFCFNY